MALPFGKGKYGYQGIEKISDNIYTCDAITDKAGNVVAAKWKRPNGEHLITEIIRENTGSFSKPKWRTSILMWVPIIKSEFLFGEMFEMKGIVKEGSLDN